MLISKLKSPLLILKRFFFFKGRIVKYHLVFPAALGKNQIWKLKKKKNPSIACAHLQYWFSASYAGGAGKICTVRWLSTVKFLQSDEKFPFLRRRYGWKSQPPLWNCINRVCVCLLLSPTRPVHNCANTTTTTAAAAIKFSLWPLLLLYTLLSLTQWIFTKKKNCQTINMHTHPDGVVVCKLQYINSSK